MKKLIFLFLFVMISIVSFTQSPQSFKYQSVIRDGSGLVIPNQLVSMRIGILEGSISGPVVYQEEHSVTTNDFGLVNLEIGNGNVVSGDFSLITWGSNSYFIKIELDENGGTTYQPMGVSQLLSVPYAMFADKAGNVNNNDTSAINELQNLSMSNDTLYL
ncbi:MAG: collagen-like protein, partial [Bacteroidota bacterium]